MQYTSQDGCLFYYDRILYSWEICEPTMLFLLGFEAITTFDNSQTDCITISKEIRNADSGITEEMDDFPTFDDILTFLSTNGPIEDSDYYVRYNCYGLKLLMNDLTGTGDDRTVPAIYRDDINKKLTDPSMYKSSPGDSYYDLQAQRIINTFRYAGYSKSDSEIPYISYEPSESESIKPDIEAYNTQLNESHELKQSCGQVYKLYDYKSMYSYALGVLYGLRCIGYDHKMIWTVEPRYWYFDKYQNLVNTAWYTFRFHYTHPIYEIENDPKLKELYQGIQLNKIWNFVHTGDNGEPESDVDMYENEVYSIYAKIKDSYDEDSMNKVESYQIMYLYPDKSDVDINNKGTYIKYDGTINDWTDPIDVWTTDNPPTGGELLNSSMNAGVIATDSDVAIRYLAHDAIPIFSALEYSKDRYLCPNDAITILKAGDVVNKYSDISYIDPFTYEEINEPLTFHAVSDNVSISLRTGIRSYKYSLNNGEWLPYVNNTFIILNYGDTCSFRCVGYVEYNPSDIEIQYARFTMPNDDSVYVSGNANSMISDDFDDTSSVVIRPYDFYKLFFLCDAIKSTPILPSMNLSAHCYESMFESCHYLVTARNLHAVELKDSCYKQMFSDCVRLTTSPKLPATILASNCYYGMFSSCRLLVNTSPLPSYEMKESCYSYMFSGCTSLTTAPQLPSKRLASMCYANMFDNCTSLEVAPKLQATHLEYNCYKHMFRNCSKLNNIVVYAVWDNDNFTIDWLNGTGSLVDNKTIWCNRDYSGFPTSTSGIPDDWNKLSVKNYVSYCLVTFTDDTTDITGYIDEAYLDVTDNYSRYIVNAPAAIREDAGNVKSSFIGIGNVGWIDFNYLYWKEFGLINNASGTEVQLLTVSEKSYKDLYNGNHNNFIDALYSKDGIVYSCYKASLTQYSPIDSKDIGIYGVFKDRVDYDNPYFNESEHFMYILSEDTFNSFFTLLDNVPSSYHSVDYYNLNIPITIYVNSEDQIYTGENGTIINLNEAGYTPSPSEQIDNVYKYDNNTLTRYDLRKYEDPDTHIVTYWSNTNKQWVDSFPENTGIKTDEKCTIYRNIEVLFDNTDIYNIDGQDGRFICNTDNQNYDLDLGFLSLSSLYDNGITEYLCTVIEKDINGESLLDSNGKPLVWYDSIKNKYWSGFVNTWQDTKPLRSNATMYDAGTNTSTPVSNWSNNIVLPDGTVKSYQEFYASPYTLGIIRSIIKAFNSSESSSILQCYYDNEYLGGARYCVPGKTDHWMKLDEFNNEGYRVVNGTISLYNVDEQEEVVYDNDPND